MHKMAAFKRLRPATLLKKRLWHSCFLVNFVKFVRTPFSRTPLGDCFYIMRRKKIKTNRNFNHFQTHKGNNKKRKMFLHFLFFVLILFLFGFTFYKEASCFIIFILSLCSNMLNLENILEYIRQKLKKHAHFKISSRYEVFTRRFFFFFIPG